MQKASFQVLIDWDSDNGLLVGDFEQGLDGWTGAASGTTAPAVARSTTRAYHGAASLQVTWSAGGSLQLVQNMPMASFVVGRSYTMSAWVWQPTGSVLVVCAVAGVTFGATSSTRDAWTQISLTFTATAATHVLQVWATGTPAGGEQTWIDQVRLIGPGEDVSDRVWDGAILLEYGRDQARSLAPVSPGRAEWNLDNSSRDYSPEYASSPLFGLLGPGREVVIEATYSGAVHTLFRGGLDDFDILPDLAERRAHMTALDGLARFRSVPVSTALYPAVRTGEAINRILDAVGWTRGRDIDPGATTIRWWWEESDDAFASLMNIVVAEGPSAFIHIGQGGEFVFRDRHHRLLRTASTTVQATFRDSGASPLFDPPFTLDLGWKDLVNSVTWTITERGPASAFAAVWTDQTSYTLPNGASRDFTIQADNPFYALQAPTQGLPTDTTDPDFVRLGGAVTVSFSRTSGQSTVMTVRNTSGVSVTVLSMRLRGYPVTAMRTLQVAKEDTASITRTGGRRPYRLNTPWFNRDDADAVADLILGQRANRLSTVTFKVVPADATSLNHQLSRDLSDRVHVIDAESGIDADCFIEHIKHVVSERGDLLESFFSCEKIPALPGNLFRFDTTGAGFDQGVFAASGIDNPSTIFLFDTAGHGFDQGLFAT